MGNIRRSIGGINLPYLDKAYDSRLNTLFSQLDKRDDVYADITLTGTCHLNGTIVSVPCAGAVIGAPYWFSTGAMSGTSDVTCSMNPPNAVRVSSTANIELTWNAAENTAGDVIGGANAVIYVQGQRVRRK